MVGMLMVLLGCVWAQRIAAGPVGRRSYVEKIGLQGGAEHGGNHVGSGLRRLDVKADLARSHPQGEGEERAARLPGIFQGV